MAKAPAKNLVPAPDDTHSTGNTRSTRKTPRARSARTLVTDPGAIPFVDLSIDNFGDIISGARSLSESGSWVVRTPLGLLVHGYEQARAILRDQTWISVLAGASVLAERNATKNDAAVANATDLPALFDRANTEQARSSQARGTQIQGTQVQGSSQARSSQAQLAPRPNVLSVEGADHHRLRRLVSSAFTPANADRLRPFMAGHARRLIDQLVADTANGHAAEPSNGHSTDGPAGSRELVAGLCRPYPIPIICELLGAPAQDWKLFDRWAETILGILDADTDALLSRVDEIVAAQTELDAYVAELVAQRQAQPGDDLLSHLIAAHDEDNNQLSGDELAAMVEALLLAGTDTTRNQLGATLAALADHPEQYEMLRQDPSLVPAAIEESLRYLGAVRSTARLATEDVEVEGLVFPAGTTVVVGLHAASLSTSDDGASAAEAASYRFDITATRSRPHLAFGSGIHHCLGAFLARAELQEALTQFLQSVESFELVEPVEWKPLSLGIWGPARMAVRLNGAASAGAAHAGAAPADTAPTADQQQTAPHIAATPRITAGTIATASPSQASQNSQTPAEAHTTNGVSDEHDLYLTRTAVLRTNVRKSLAALVKPPRVPPLGRLVITALLIGWPLIVMRGWDQLFKRNLTSEQRLSRTYRRLRKAAEKLGPSYIKLAQLIAAGEGVFPDALVSECRSCRDQVTAVPWKQTRQTLEAELGPLHKRFASIDPTPLAAASIAQAHLARLADGTEVVIKVQRPRINRRIKQDIAVLAWVAPRLVGKIPIAALANPPALVELFAETISEELDFRIEVANMIEVDRALRARPGSTAKTGWRLPTPYLDAVTKRVIVMSRVAGRPLSSIGVGDLPAAAAGDIFRQMTNSLLEGTCVHGIFHGDFHAGNVLVDDDGNIGLVDFGITGRLEGHRRIAFLRYVVGLLTGDVVAQLEGMGQLGAFSTGPNGTGLDSTQLAAELGLDRSDFDPLRLSEEEFVAEFRALISGLLSHGARIPKELMLFIKNFAYITSIMGELDPDMDILSQFERTASSFVARNGVRMAGEIGFSVAPEDVTETALRQAMGVSSQEPKVTWRLLRRRRQEMAERIAKSPADAPASSAGPPIGSSASSPANSPAGSPSQSR